MPDYPVLDGNGNVIVGAPNVSNYDARTQFALTDVAAAATVTGKWLRLTDPNTRNVVVQGHISGTGSVSATIIFDVANDIKFPQLGIVTLSLSGTGSDSAANADTIAGWAFIRARLTAVSGTDRKVNAIVRG